MLIMRKQQGLSLIELLIGLAIGMTAISALVSFIGYGIGVNTKTITKSKLTEESETILEFLSTEIKRSGYTSNTIALIQDPEANPSLFRNSILVSEHPDELVDTCILFSYDFNANGIVDTLGVNENFGFRLRNGNVQIRQNGSLCESDWHWSTISDSGTITIDALSFISSPVTIDGVTRTQITVALSTQSTSSQSLTSALSREFLVRNYD